MGLSLLGENGSPGIKLLRSWNANIFSGDNLGDLFSPPIHPDLLPTWTLSLFILPGSWNTTQTLFCRTTSCITCVKRICLIYLSITFPRVIASFLGSKCVSHSDFLSAPAAPCLSWIQQLDYIAPMMQTVDILCCLSVSTCTDNVSRAVWSPSFTLRIFPNVALTASLCLSQQMQEREAVNSIQSQTANCF